MCWLAVSKIYIPIGVKLFGEVYPIQANNLIKFLFLNGLDSYQKINTSWGQLSIGRYSSLQSIQQLDEIVKNNINYQLRSNYFSTYNIQQERIYIGLEEKFNSKSNGIILPPIDYKVLTKLNYNIQYNESNTNLQS